MEIPTTRAALKRYLKVGAELRCIWRHYVEGNVCDQYLKVMKAQTDSVQFHPTQPDKPGSWIYVTGASSKAFTYDFERDGYTVSDAKTGKKLAVYRYLIHEPDCNVDDGSCQCSKPTASVERGHDPDGLRSE